MYILKQVMEKWVIVLPFITNLDFNFNNTDLSWNIVSVITFIIWTYIWATKTEQDVRLCSIWILFSPLTTVRSPSNFTSTILGTTCCLVADFRIVPQVIQRVGAWFYPNLHYRFSSFRRKYHIELKLSSFCKVIILVEQTH